MTVEPAPSRGAGTRGTSLDLGEGRAGRCIADDDARVRRIERQQWLCRRDLERQLHDGAALRISALALRLALVRRERAACEEAFQSSVDGLQDELHHVLQELRDVALRIYPPLLDQAGLGPALLEAGARLGTPVRVVAPNDRFGPAAEGAAYFALLDVLRAGPAGPGCGDRPMEVDVRRDGDALVLLIEGVDPCHAASIQDVIRHLGGAVEAIGASKITVRVPCE